MYRFKSGKLADMTMEHAFLRKAPQLYSIASWAREKPHLFRLVVEFDRLRKKLRHAPVKVWCEKSGCKRRATAMTLPRDYKHDYLPDPYFWCEKHEPWENEGISPKLPISFDTIGSFKDKKKRAAVHRSVLDAIGITKHRGSISEKFANDFFAALD